jgi:hypothetical protein
LPYLTTFRCTRDNEVIDGQSEDRDAASALLDAYANRTVPIGTTPQQLLARLQDLTAEYNDLGHPWLLAAHVAIEHIERGQSHPYWAGPPAQPRGSPRWHQRAAATLVGARAGALAVCIPTI